MAAPRKMENAGGREYKYFTEISQMMFVFGEVQDPMPETVNLVEDIVRSQIIELVSAALGAAASLGSSAGADHTGEDACVQARGSLSLCRRPDIPHPP